MTTSSRQTHLKGIAIQSEVGSERGRNWRRRSCVSDGRFISAEQVSRIHLQNPRNLLDSFQARIVPAALKRADIGSIKARLIGKSLLRQLCRFSCGSKIPCKTLPYVHWTHNSRLRRILHGVYSSLSLNAACAAPFPQRRQR